MKLCGLSKKERILKPIQFRHAFQQGALAKTEHIWLYSCQNGLSYNRIGISVSKKRVANAADRNQIKRIIREFYRTSKNRFGSGADLIFVLRKAPAKAQSLNKAMSSLCRNDEENTDLKH